MSIQWADDFSRYGTGNASRTAMLEGLPYANIVSGSGGRGEVHNDPDPNETGRAFRLPSGAPTWQNQFRIALPTVISGTGRIALRWWLSNLPNSTAERPTIGYQAGNGDIIVLMYVEQNGSITVQGQVSNVLTQVADSVNPVISPSSWNHVEFQHNRATGAGALYLNGVQILTWTGVDTADNLELVQITAASGNTLSLVAHIKDLVLSDSVGTVNNGVNGTVIVRRLSPSADNTLGGWTPSTGVTGFPLLDKAAPNDTTYMSADDTPPAPMAFALDNLPPDITSVRALLSVVRMRKIDGGDATVENSLSPNGTNWDAGADRPITSAFSYYFDVSELDPATSTAWSPTAVDSALLRIDRNT
jgi:hypothetical protein